MKARKSTYHDDGGGGHENVAWKVNFRSFNLYRDYINSLTLSKASELFLSRIPNNYIQVQKGRLFTFSIQREIRHLPFSRRSRAVSAKKCTKKRNAGAELLFC